MSGQMEAEQHDEEQRQVQRTIGAALADVERAINEALVTIHNHDKPLRHALLSARAEIRRAAGEGRKEEDGLRLRS